MTIYGLRSKIKDPVTSSWLSMKGMKPGFIARAVCWSSAAVRNITRKTFILLDAWLLLFPLHFCDEVFLFGTPGPHVRANETSICWICDMGGQNIWMWDVRSQNVRIWEVNHWDV